MAKSNKPGALGNGTGNKDGYVLGRGYAASTRLNFQHHLWEKTQGFLLHPWIREQLEKAKTDGLLEELAVADLATGTGVWLLELLRSHELQDIPLRLSGYDISAGLFPQKTWLPPSVSLATSNLLLDPPEELHSKFDVLHIRLVVSVAPEGDPTVKKMIRHMHKLLKPGGLLQWDEVDILGHHQVITAGSVDGSETAMNQIFNKVRSTGDYSWVTRIPQLLLENGFEDATQQIYEPAPQDYHSWTCAELMMAEELSWNKTDDRTGDVLRNKIKQAYEEANDESIGAVLKSSPTVTVARKS